MDERIVEILKAEKEKLISLFGSKKCFGEGTSFASAQEYDSALGSLVRTDQMLLQIEQMKEMKRKQEEQAAQMAKEAGEENV